MIGAPHAGGSITSNGGDSSPSGSVIVGRCPFEAAGGRLCQKNADLMKPHCRQSQLLCQAKTSDENVGCALSEGEGGNYRAIRPPASFGAAWRRPSPEIYHPSG